MVALKKIRELKEHQTINCPECRSENYLIDSCKFIICDHCTSVFEIKQKQEIKVEQISDNIISLSFPTIEKKQNNFKIACCYVLALIPFFILVSSLSGIFLNYTNNKSVKISEYNLENNKITFLMNNTGNKKVHQSKILVSYFSNSGNLIKNEHIDLENKINKNSTIKISQDLKPVKGAKYYSMEIVSAS